MAGSYAPYGNAIFGETVYGIPSTSNLSTSVSVQPVLSSSGTYTSLQVNWVLPGGVWDQLVLVRSSYGVPVSPYQNDGVTLLSQSSAPFSTTFVDSGLVSGRFYYYSLFVFALSGAATPGWVLAGSAQGLCLTDYDFSAKYFSWTPDWYLEQDATLATATQPEGPYERFLDLIGFEMDWVRSEIESLFTLTSPEFISGAMLPYMCANLGITYEPQLGMRRSRVLAENAVGLYKTKGTFEGSTATPGGIEGAASAFSGYSCALTLSQNLEIQLDDAAFDQSQGHWVPENAGTSLSVIPTSTLGFASEHSTYNPLPTELGLEAIYGVTGYLPPDNQNVLQMTAQSSASWAQLLQTQGFPAARSNAAFAYNTVANQFVMFGGTALNGGGSLFDTWVWNGTYWTQQFPTTVPNISPGAGAVMCYDITNNNIVLVGKNPSGGAFETYTWNGTNWTKKSPATSPPSTQTLASPVCPGKFGATLEVLLITSKPSLGGLLLWAWNGTTWTQVSASLPFSPFGPQAFGYDQTSGDNVAFVGLVGSTYVWNGSSWTNPTPSTTPAAGNVVMTPLALSGHHLILVDKNNATWSYTVASSTWTDITTMTTPSTGAICYYTGANVIAAAALMSGSVYYFTTEVFNGSTWSTAQGQQYPLPRWNASMATSSTGTVYLFGGYNPAYGYLNDTWSWNGSTWTQLSPASSPSARQYAPLVSIGGGILVLFGGNNGSDLGDTWTFNGTTWTHVTTTGSPSARSEHTMVFDSNISEVILFGGGNGNDTWYYNNGTTTWTQQSPATKPPILNGASMVYTTGGISILFGGQHFPKALGESNQTWQWNSNGTPNWTQLSPAVSPPARFFAPMAYDAASSTIFLLGGVAGNHNIFLSDEWQYSGTNWSQVTPTPNPGTRVSSAITYIPSSQSVLLFGGGLSLATTEPSLGDTWSLSEGAYGIDISECDQTNATLLGIPVTPQFANVALVQNGDSGDLFIASNSPATILPNNTTPGNTLVICIADGSGTNGDVASITSPIFSSITRINSIGNVASDMEIWVAPITGAGKTITAVLTNPIFGYTVAAFEFPGSFTATSAGTQGSNSASGEITQSFTGLAPNAQQVLLALAQSDSGFATAPTLPWFDYNGSDSSLWSLSAGMDIAWLINPTTPSASATWNTIVNTEGYTLNGLILTPVVEGPEIILSAYFRPVPVATPTLESFFTQIDWYAINGGFISSSAGSPVNESNSSWVRASVAALPPANAAYFGRTVKSVSTAMNGDLHLMDAVQTEINSQATPSPTPWTPPRDFQLNLLPSRQNLVPNPVGLGGPSGSYGILEALFSTFIGTQTPPAAASWPNATDSGWIWKASSSSGQRVISQVIPVQPNTAYTFSVSSLAAATPRSIGVEIQFGTVLGQPLSNPYTSAFTDSTTAFERGSVTAISPEADVPLYVVWAIFYTGVTNEIHYISSLLVEPTAALQPYFDGNFSPAPDFSFEGTPNESPSDYYPAFNDRIARLVTVMPDYIPIGSTFSIFTGASAFSNAGLTD